MPTRDRHAERHAMVRRQLQGRDITDRRVCAALGAIPREHFIPCARDAEAYADRPLPIGLGQTISQPYIVALMTQAAHLTRRSRVLEIGGGSGYHAAVLGRIADRVWSVERLPALAADARARLRSLGIDNVHVLVGDGRYGYTAAAPYDAILVAAATKTPPPALLRQLALDGRLVIPLGPSDVQDLEVWQRTASGTRRDVLCACCFVPLIGDR
ncbi:MAG: protein-L-isoaspartate(D-aspartate) O-methyltransferase [Gemmatimonadota bacterium]|nr:protein-L-isoaspartate(D-aspartate) O-methyltransferase [Gemmatimonadota bacterium]MDH5197413.1 protein-L-isoaspartate(D-aspartate) O-methyltransferase [Gemmatimonadota bacterium]